MSTRAKRSGGLKMRDWRGGDLPGVWHVSRKIDGVCTIVTPDGDAVSRAGKPLYNVPWLAPGVYECYLGSWEATVSALRTHNGRMLRETDFYSLASVHGAPTVDLRLVVGVWDSPTEAQIRMGLALRLAAGDEGLILVEAVKDPTGSCTPVHKPAYWKVKQRVTYDVPVTGIIPGKGKHAGRMGALVTPRGNVGTGFSDKDRVDLLRVTKLQHEVVAPSLSGNVAIIKARGAPLIIEVECMGLTPSGKFRHPRFLRIRWDK